MAEHRGTVGEPPMILGYAGLLPQVAALATSVFDGSSQLGAMFALGYASLILSFIGGIWWGFAMRDGEGQARLAALSVVPSLVAAALILLAIARLTATGWILVLLGSAVLLTLWVDRRLAAEGVAPRGWMGLRVPLSVGLGALTILCGVVG